MALNRLKIVLARG